MVSFARTLALLYQQTCTGKDLNYLANPKIVKIINSLQNRKLYPESKHFSNAEISDVIHFLLRLTDTPVKKLEGLLALKPCTMYLLEQVFTHLIMVEAVDKDPLLGLARRFYAILETTSNPNDFRRYIAKPLYEQSPLARFHYDAYTSSLLKDGSFPLYTAYGSILHKRIRFILVHKLGDITVEDYIRSARYFFIYMPDRIKNKKTHPLSISQEYVDAAINEYNLKSTKSYFPLTDDAIKYKKSFKRILDGWEGTPSPRLGYIPEDELVPLDGDVEILDKDILGYLNAGVLVSEDDPRWLEEPYMDLELGYLIKELRSKDDFVSRKPTLTRQWNDTVNLRNFHYPWDVKHLNLFHYAVLYHAIAQYYASNSYRMIIVYLLILIHTGIDYKKLISMVAQESGAPKDELILRKLDGRYYILCPSFIDRKDPLQNIHCQDTSPVVYVPIPDVIMRLFKVPKHGNVFSIPDSKGNAGVPLTLATIKDFLNKVVNKISDKKQYKLNITLSKITSSFATLYSDRCGLDKLLCIYISGHDYHRLHSAQAYYIHIPHEKLEREYLSAFHRANKIILNNYAHCLEHNFLNKLSNPNPPLIERLKNTEHAESTPSTQMKGYGSSIIVKDNYIRMVMQSLEDRLQNSADVIHKHNLYMCYAFLAFQFNTAMRPRNYPELTWDDFNERLGTIVIRDKASAKFHELRSVPLTKRVITLLSNVRKGIDRLRRHIALHHYPSIYSAKQEEIFFFVSGNGRFVPFDLENLSTILSSVILDYNLPANMPRHYLRNFLYHSGFSHDVVDAIFGHQHNGRELLNIISTAIPSDIGELIIPSIDEMLDDLGIKVIAYV